MLQSKCLDVYVCCNLTDILYYHRKYNRVRCVVLFIFQKKGYIFISLVHQKCVEATQPLAILTITEESLCNHKNNNLTLARKKMLLQTAKLLLVYENVLCSSWSAFSLHFHLSEWSVHWSLLTGFDLILSNAGATKKSEAASIKPQLSPWIAALNLIVLENRIAYLFILTGSIVLIFYSRTSL